MTIKEFEHETGLAIRSLPAFFKERLVNVVVIVRTGRSGGARGSGVLGLYEGVPLPQRGLSYSGAMPDKITLFKENIEAACGSGVSVKAEIRNVLMHEIAHHFGMSDGELRKKGLY